MRIPLISIVIYLVVVGTSFFALIPRDYYLSPKPSDLWELYKQELEIYTKRRVRATMTEDYQENEKVITQKVRWTKAAFITLAIEAFFVAVILFFQNAV